MTKTQSVANLSAEKSEPALRKVQTERAIQDLIKDLAQSLTTLSEENQATARGLLNRMTKSADAADKSIGKSTEKARTSAEALNKAAKRLEQANQRNRWTTLVAISLLGFTVGSLSLLTLLILQPRLLSSLWKVSQALGIAP